MTPIINISKRKGTFKGDPNGFVSFPKGTLFRRRLYEYNVMEVGKPWKKYDGVYYEPNPREYEADENETIWFKTTDVSDRSGWVKLPRNQQEDESCMLLVGDDVYLSDNGNEIGSTFLIYN